jgi:hypothetical protein
MRGAPAFSVADLDHWGPRNQWHLLNDCRPQKMRMVAADQRDVWGSVP